MAHFAILDGSNAVTNVVVVANDVLLDGEGVEQEQLGKDFLTSLYGAGNYVQTSYNSNFRKQWGSIGCTYDSAKDKFIREKPYPSWVLDENDDWTAPVAYPIVAQGTGEKRFDWDEDTTNWVDAGENPGEKFDDG